MTSVPPINMQELPDVFRRFPAAMWRAMADGYDRAFRGAWKAFKSQMPIKKTSGSWTLTSPKLWPFEITYSPESERRPDFRRFRARWGNIAGDGSRAGVAAAGLEAGGTSRPERGKWIAIPINDARKASGARKPNFRSPFIARRRNNDFIATFKGGKGLLWRLEKPQIFGPRVKGRTPKGFRRKARLVRSQKPYFILVRSTRLPVGYLGFHRTWKSEAPNTARRLQSSLEKGAQAALAGKTLTYFRGLKRDIPY